MVCLRWNPIVSTVLPWMFNFSNVQAKPGVGRTQVHFPSSAQDSVDEPCFILWTCRGFSVGKFIHHSSWLGLWYATADNPFKGSILMRLPGIKLCPSDYPTPNGASDDLRPEVPLGATGGAPSLFNIHYFRTYSTQCQECLSNHSKWHAGYNMIPAEHEEDCKFNIEKKLLNIFSHKCS